MEVSATILTGGPEKTCPLGASLALLRGLAAAMNHAYRGNVSNAVLQPCFMCLNPDIDLKTIRQYEIENEDLKKQILILKNSDSCFRALDKLPKIPSKIKLLEKKMLMSDFYNNHFKTCFNTTKVKMITLTFDRHKFKELKNRQAQRNYFQYIIDKWEPLTPIYGCFELHEDGVVHTHFMVHNITDNDLQFFKSWLTNHDANIHAVHACDKIQREAFDYINKPETKDKNAIFNFYKNI